jgi:DNA-binding MarR family transcriptional regulator
MIGPVERTVMQKLVPGAAWMRSLGMATPVVRRLVADGLVERCVPEGGTAQNMVRLTPRGYARLGIDPPIISTLDRFAEHLSEHGDASRAATQLGFHEAYGRVLLQKLVKGLGWQAA